MSSWSDILRFLTFGKRPEKVAWEIQEEERAKIESKLDEGYKNSIFYKWFKEREKELLSSNKSVAEIFGLKMTQRDSAAEITAKRAENPIEQNPYIEADKNGNILPEQFNLDYIKNKYDAENYIVTEELNDQDDFIDRYIHVVDKKTLKPVIDYNTFESAFHESKNVNIYNSYGELEQHLYIVKNGVLSILLKEKNANNYSLVCFNEHTPNGNGRSILYDQETGKAKTIKTYYYGVQISYIKYVDGKKYKALDKYGNTITNFFADDLANCLNNKNFRGRVKNVNELKSLIYQLNENNIYEVAVAYNQKTGKSFIDDLKKNLLGWMPIGRDFSTYQFLSRYVKEILYRPFSSFDTAENEAFAEYAVEDIIKNPEKSYYYNLINETSCKYVLNEYKRKAQENNLPTNNMLEAIMQCENVDIDTRIRNVMKQIHNSIYIHDADLLKQITDVGFKIVMEHCKEGCEDIKDHMILNKDNPKILQIDLERYYNRDEVSEPPEISKPNGKIDIECEQGRTGDCWLLAGCISMFKKPDGQKVLESLIDVNKDTGDVVVNLKGVNKTYTITFDEITNAKYLSGGDGDIRAIEIAFNKYIHEKAIEEKNIKTVDINGNSITFIYEILLGNTEIVNHYSPEMNNDFNNPDKYYELASSGFDFDTGKSISYSDLKDALINENGEPVDFHTGHAYAVVKSDENYVYLVNPWNSSETLRITPEKLESLLIMVGAGWAD